MLLAVPATALAFDSVDLIPYTSSGAYPAYPGDDVRPLSGFVEAGMEHDSNPFRLSNSVSPQSDTIVRYGGGLRYAQRVAGRQRILLEGRGDYYNYSHAEVLDHFAYNLLGEWQWELGNSLAGAIGAGRVFRIADPSQVQRETREDVTIDRAYANGGWLFATNWRVRAGVELENSKRERPTAAPVRADTSGVRVGLDYVTPLANTFGVEARSSKGDAPVGDLVDPTGQFAGNDFTEDEVAAVVSYGATSSVRVGGRVGYTERKYTVIPGRDFSGTTWRALVEWLPGNKTILGFETGDRRRREPRYRARQRVRPELGAARQAGVLRPHLPGGPRVDRHARVDPARRADARRQPHRRAPGRRLGAGALRRGGPGRGKRQAHLDRSAARLRVHHGVG